MRDREQQPSSKLTVVIPTKDRASDLAALLQTLLDQTSPALEIIIVDDSKTGVTEHLVSHLESRFASIGCKIRYMRGNGAGNTAARNAGIQISRGDLILFLDDDTLLDRDVIERLTSFLRETPMVIGVQPRIEPFAKYWSQSNFRVRLQNTINRAAMVNYHEDNRLAVRRSGATIYPIRLNKVIPVQRLLGCAFCVRRDVALTTLFDTNLKLWGCFDDLDFSFRIDRKYPLSLYVVPNVSVFHKQSSAARLPERQAQRMTTVYWFYVFFKELYRGSIINLVSLFWAINGYLLLLISRYVMTREKHALLTFGYLIVDSLFSLRHLREIRMGNLDFYNLALVQQNSVASRSASLSRG